MPERGERPAVWMQCPGCWSASLHPAPTTEIYIECDCGEKLTVIDLRDGGCLTMDRGDLEDWGATNDQLTGKYHPDPEINEGVAADALEGEKANLAAGFNPTPWECECGAAHARGHFEAIGIHRCLRCGNVGQGGRLMDAEEFERYRERAHAL